MPRSPRPSRAGEGAGALPAYRRSCLRDPRYAPPAAAGGLRAAGNRCAAAVRAARSRVPTLRGHRAARSPASRTRASGSSATFSPDGASASTARRSSPGRGSSPRCSRGLPSHAQAWITRHEDRAPARRVAGLVSAGRSPLPGARRLGHELAPPARDRPAAAGLVGRRALARGLHALHPVSGPRERRRGDSLGRGLRRRPRRPAPARPPIPFHPRASRAAGSALFQVPFYQGPSIQELASRQRPDHRPGYLGTRAERGPFPLDLRPGRRRRRARASRSSAAGTAAADRHDARRSNRSTRPRPRRSLSTPGREADRATTPRWKPISRRSAPRLELLTRLSSPRGRGGEARGG